MNDRLRAALSRRNTTVAESEIATAAEVDPKTVARWLGGRVPHPRHRHTVAELLGDDQEFLWPGAGRGKDRAHTASAELVAAYPFRSDVPKATWWNAVQSATRTIDLLGYTLYFLPLEHPHLIATLKAKCENGCVVRTVVADPNCGYVSDRDAEEDLALTLGARIQTSLKYFQPLFECAGFELRYQRIPLYNSIFRFDDTMLVTPHLYATPGASAPVLHLRRLGADGLFARFADHFAAVWATTTPHVEKDSSEKRSQR